jgi:putative transposase
VRTHDDAGVAGLLRTVLDTKPIEGDTSSVRTFAAETGISESVVQRYVSLFGVQPHRTKSFTLSTDP